MMRRWLPLLFCFAALLFAVRFSDARAVLRVNEAATRFSLDDKQARLALAVENGTGRTLAARVEIELLDPRGRVRARAAQDSNVEAGSSVVVVPVDFDYASLEQATRREFLLYRLRYRITPPARDGGRADAAQGIISVSEAAPDIFELRVSSARQARAGTSYRARVRATNPVSARAVEGVRVEGEWKLDDATVTKATGVTDADGFALLDFDLPRRIATGEGELRITGRRGMLMQTAEAEVGFDRTAQVLITTDKPLYQPGQMLHLRALVFDASRRAVADAATSVKLFDPEGATVFRTQLKTSRFGVASTDWKIPENTRLGDYVVEVEMDDGAHEDSTAQHAVKISRYDLPNFAVSVKPDRSYYLPGEHAEVVVRGDYLFGQPLQRGSVRVVRQTERRWNYREQKYEVAEEREQKGDLDAAGSFVARLDLTPEHQRLADQTWQRFEDIGFAAYITDPTTNRTEQRRFNLRVTRDPIHVYVNSDYYRQAKGLPLKLFVSTSYADGTPASCEVEISRTFENNYRPADASLEATPEAGVVRVQTNRYGVAKALLAPVPRGQTGDGERVEFTFKARDREGRAGRRTEDFWLSGEASIRVETGKALYREGEPIDVSVTSNEPDPTVHVDVMRDLRIVASRSVRLRDGRATLTLPYDREFQGKLVIAATSDKIPTGQYYYYSSRYVGTRAIIYPRDRELKLDVKFGRATYRPGEESSADLQVRAPDGRAVESVLGVVVFDKAVEERSRTNQDFNSAGYGFGGYFYGYWYGYDEAGGITRRDIEQVDMSKPLPDGYDLVAELLLSNSDSDYHPNIFGAGEFETNQLALFSTPVTEQLKPLHDALDARYAERGEYPAAEASLRKILAEARIDFDALRDPWGMPYRAAFSVKTVNDVLTLVSTGADKRASADDFDALRLAWPYFRPVGEHINHAVETYYRRTGEHVRDEATFKTELRRAGVDFDSLRDRWGQPYALRFGTSGTNYTVQVVSAGTNGRFETVGAYAPDDFIVWTTWSDYFAKTRAGVERALAANIRANGTFPKDKPTLRATLRKYGVDLDAARDAWGNPYYVVFKTELRRADRIVLESRGQYRYGRPQQRTEVTPVSQTLDIIKFRSNGEDGKAGTSDDFDATQFSSVAFEQAANDARPQAVRRVTPLTKGTGGIRGIVTDPMTAVIPNASVTATHMSAGSVYAATTNDEGEYLLRNLPTGFYRVRFEASGFAATEISEVVVHVSSLTTLNVALDVSVVAETVEVSAGSAGWRVEMNVSSVRGQKRKSNNYVIDGADNNNPPRGQISTPRLREHFPETLLWQPALETDRDGRAQLRFKLADNITTWKVSVIGSTADGEIGTAEEEIRAFQPFFVEHDPPRILTEGDEISLPVVLRNYLAAQQAVELEIKPESWFKLLGASKKKADVAAGDASRQTFDFRAAASVNDGKQRITAIAGEASDAIEKPVTVHPDGEEVTTTAADIFDRAATLDLDVAADAIPRTARGELKIYPNLAAHVVESVEGIMRRPYGCGEQTISSAYPSLQVLRHYKRRGGGTELPIAARAERYVRLAYERLLGYRAADGGFTYWGRGEADLALTAYALRFLTDAREVVEVDENVVRAARAWLVKQQRADGSWPATEWWEKTESRVRTTMRTAYVARVLASSQTRAADDKGASLNETPDDDDGADSEDNDDGDSTDADGSTDADDKANASALQRALGFLAGRIDEIDEPYIIASYALAASDAGERAGAARAVAKLRTLARNEATATYWSLETNTPFYGWGLAGRIETTALVVQALARDAESEGSDKASIPAATDARAVDASGDALINRGLLFLLRSKDRYGVWYSTQATVNVIDALLALVNKRDAARPDANRAAGQTGAGDSTEIVVNGRLATTVSMPPENQLTSPLVIDLAPFLSTGANRVELRRGAGDSYAQVHAVASYYVPWSRSSARAEQAQKTQKANASSTLRLAVSYDKPRAEISQEINCRVEAERIAFKGYGMLLAEIGLPPGADVDRASLERAMSESGWSFSRYDILPDKLVVYLWPRAGGVRFDFKFRPRFGLAAQTAPSVLYDYYNPEESRTVVAPTKFVVR